MSSVAKHFERFLALAGFDRGPWIAVAFGLGIVAWFLLSEPWQWSAGIGAGVICAIFGATLGRPDGHLQLLPRAMIVVGLVFSLGMATIWARSWMVGAEPIERPAVITLQGHVLERQDQPAESRVRLVLAIRDAEAGVARKIRVNVPAEDIGEGMSEGAVLRLRTRLMPPAAPMLPGGYDFARTAWFAGLAATGSVIGPIEVVEPAPKRTALANIQRRLSGHVRSQLDGPEGAIAAAFASGDRGAIGQADEDAMRDAGLTHLLSISGLHVSAVIAAAYVLAIRLLALWPALVLRIRLPVAAAGIAALAGIGYTLLTGSQVPTVRSCIAALLVLGAVALGRDALSLRMVAVAAVCVMILWPESIVGPSFQMSFAAVIAIVALHNSAPVKRFLAPREEARVIWFARRSVMLLVTGLVIEIALMPIVLFHFHRAGVYGALANVIAIPLVTFVSMPLIALALVLDIVGAGAPAWWLVGHSLDLLLWLAHVTASQPGAVKLMPQMSDGTFTLFVAGGLWIGLWSGRARLLGLIPAGFATILLLLTPVPDVLISSDGRHVGITTQDGRLLSLRDSRSDYALENLMELAGVEAEPIPLEDWPTAGCTSEFCVLSLERGGKTWSLLMARNRVRVEERALAAACERADIVIADRWLPSSCRPQWLKADARFLERSGGLSLDLENGTITSVALSQGKHGWWRGAD
ncbi:ComEC/Rec2 family competence protein [Altererythrobacter arenosus]|uniref:ComEC/Rec2 family competence protein n=1 Tax=Altererythrobacter arenosus TaxID=3032592 RepID=A0ABY8FQ32_9SPHN|nr:ComEC/Rec2 family competence protein [Altererythrobacter sp. CAU 1644]WFL77126.1 ComEC/Rec2 family competence protein [Altererythrobacter sp. CAU 1644]